MDNSEKIWNLSKEKYPSLRRGYNWWNSLFIALLVAFIVQGINLLKEAFYKPTPSTFIITIISIGLISIFIIISVKERTQHEIALEIKENKLKKSDAIKYIVKN